MQPNIVVGWKKIILINLCKIASMQKVVLFDGVCNLCNSSVQKLIRWDKKETLKFASLQSKFGQRLLSDLKLDKDNFTSILYLKGNQVFTRSTAAILILTDLGGGWKIMRIFYLIPKILRDKIYDWISKNRYKWFGKKEQCWLPTPELKKRFLN